MYTHCLDKTRERVEARIQEERQAQVQAKEKPAFEPAQWQSDVFEVPK